MQKISLQKTYSPNSRCFGCGQSNSEGLRLESYVVEDSEEIIAQWQSKSCYEAFHGILGGGIISVLLDCHSNWSATWTLMQYNHFERPPGTVTSEYSIQFHRPVETRHIIHLVAKPVQIESSRVVVVESKLLVNDIICTSFRGKFVAVKEGHPAYLRWE